ncbi:DUF4440 domain-containing protein [Flavihumibacter petaseus]|uniref:DUF4440 domain-containing protein n=1 Tax=Flavihumibacter petaseus NBRC 106054 TaxID=1220578 RepID=A0A0E9N6G8_9BACT|nr:DUF4440 domain-containing protein [Flavihumibacter petaseus]GAO45321.1 hypothetical protein FPE01S_05_00180 [Flavihumibacter petaseus NBRC 106054]
MKTLPIVLNIILLFVLTTICSSTTAQVPRDSELFLTMQRHDSIFFERAFNLCDTAYVNRATDKDLVFYHDRNGISYKKQFLENTAKYLCSDWNNKPIRKVKKESLEVYPLYNQDKLYGVVQSGIHDFYRRTPGKPDQLMGSAKFTHVYLLVGSDWILKEVLSFDHK